MSVITNNLLLGDEGYFLTKSLRFRSSASAYLDRTPASAGNRKTFTFSTWIKLGEIAASNGTVFSAGTSSGESTRFYLRYTGSQFQTGYGSQNLDTTVAVFRDPSAWYHLVLSVDTTQVTAANRLKIYVNGVQQSVTTSVNFTQNVDTAVNNTVAHNICREAAISTGYVDGYLTEVNFIDGQALTPSSFGETSTSTGVWIPKKYTGTYGTNGFYLPFTDVATTSGSNAGLGKDFSGNGNYWNTNNISVTTGSTYDSMNDVPTLTSATAANYGTLNPLYKGSLQTISNANLTSSKSSGTSISDVWGTFGMTSGKWYFECSVSALSATVYIGVGQGGGTGEPTDDLAVSPASYFYGSADGNKFYGNTGTAYGDTFGAGNIIGCAIDMDNGKIWWSKDGTWQASGDPAAGTNAAFTDLLTRGSNAFLAFSSTNGASNSNTLNWNFGQQPFAYTPPTGFKALNTFNLPTPTIGATASTTANKYFDATLYTGTGSSQSITNSGSMQPDLVWAKNRGAANYNALTDSVRGVQNQIYSNTTDAELTGSNGLTAFNTNGFTVGTNANWNNNTYAFVGWQWKANGSGSTNTAGSITSTVSANTTAGFSIVTYTGTGANATVGHGLGVAPKWVIVKGRNVGSTNWFIYTDTQGATKYLDFSTGTGGTDTSAWNSTAPTSTVFSVGTSYYTNYSATTYVAYCFAQVAGYSAFGSYTGNGSSDGTFVYTGFRPRYFMVKRTDASSYDWILMDTARDPINVATQELYADLSIAEGTAANNYDILSNGFKARRSNAAVNASGGTYIYMAFAESPFKYSLAR